MTAALETEDDTACGYSCPKAPRGLSSGRAVGPFISAAKI